MTTVELSPIVTGITITVTGGLLYLAIKWIGEAIAAQVTTDLGDRLEPRITEAVQRETEPLHGTVHAIETLLHDTRNQLERHLPPDGAAFANGASTAVESLNEGYHDRREIKRTLADLGERFAALEQRIDQALKAS